MPESVRQTNLEPLQKTEKSLLFHVRFRVIDEIRQAFGAAKEDVFTLVHKFSRTRAFAIERLSAHRVTYGYFSLFSIKACVLITAAALSTRIRHRRPLYLRFIPMNRQKN